MKTHDENKNSSRRVHRLMSRPSTSLPLRVSVPQHRVLELQRVMGNRAVSGQIQTMPLQRRSAEAEVMDRVRQYDPYIKEASARYGIPVEKIRAIIATESGGNPNATSGAAFGLMQITKGTWLDIQRSYPELKNYDFTEANWKDPRINIMVGTAVFKSKMKAVGVESSDAGSAELAVIAYNAGEGTVKAAIANAQNAGSKNPTVDCLRPEYLKPAIRKTGIHSYYLRGKGGKYNPYVNGTQPYDEEAATEAAVDLKYKEVSRYPGKVQMYLALQQSDTGTATSTGTFTAESQSPKQNSNEPKAQVYQVQPGEGLQAIANKLGVTVAALKEANKDKLKQWKTKSGGVIEGFNAGEIIRVPSSSSRTESQVKTLEKTPPKKDGFNVWDMIKQGQAMLNSGIEQIGEVAKNIWQGIFGGGNKSTEGTSNGSTIAFSAGQYALGTLAGRQLMAHELTHVMQQGGAPHQVQHKPAKSLSYTSNAEGYFDVANQITSIMEGGSSKGRYDALTTIDDGGIISYGKHQATLSSGSLGMVLEAYIASSQSATAEVIRGYMDRVRRKDVMLKNEKALLDALRSAASEKEMQVAQDMVFSKGYWNPAVKAAQGAGIQSPLGYAMLYDTKIQGGMEACLKAARTACGGDVGQKVGDKIISEIEFLTAFNDAREERLERIAQTAEKDGNRTKANAVRGSKYRCAAFRELLKAGNLNVAGPGGEVEILGPGKKPYKIEGFDLGKDTQENSGHKPESDRSAQSPEPVIGTATVTASALNVRQAPSAEAAKLGVLSKDQQVDVTGREGNWLRVVYRSAPAFINSNYALFTPRTVTSQPGLLEQIAGLDQKVGAGIAGAAQTARKWSTDLFGSGQPGGQTQTPGEEKHIPAYESQRDNAYSQRDDLGDLVYGDVMCNVTTLAMQIETLAGSQEKAVRAAVSLLIKNDPTLAAQSDKLCKQQLEDLIMQRFDQISAGKPGWKKVLGNEYANAAELHNVSKYGWHQLAACLRCVGAEFTEFVSLDKKPVTDGGMTKEYYQKELRPKIERDRATVMLSTNLTSSGHIVLLVQVLDDGILVHDPYGALLDRQGYYLKNGTSKADAVDRLGKARKGILDDRLKYNKNLLNLLTKLLSDDKFNGNMPQNLGELNFFTWDEVQAFSMGKWNNILYGKP